MDECVHTFGTGVRIHLLTPRVAPLPLPLPAIRDNIAAKKNNSTSISANMSISTIESPLHVWEGTAANEDVVSQARGA